MESIVIYYIFALFNNNSYNGCKYSKIMTIQKIKIVKSPNVKDTLLAIKKGDTVKAMYKELNIVSVRSWASRLKKSGDDFDIQAIKNSSYYTITRR